MRRIRYAIVHRYASWLLNTDTGKFMFEDELKIESESKIRGLAACLRLIRPTSQYTQFCSYKVNPEGKLLHFAFDIPMEFVNMPSNQRQFSVRQRDIEALRRYALPFLDAMNGEFWKFRMAVQMHDLAHFQNLEW